MMNLDPVLFESSMHETANEAVLFCQEYLEEKGYEDIASALAGHLPLTDDTATYVVVCLLERALPRVQGEAVEYVRIALNTARRALAGERAPLSAVA